MFSLHVTALHSTLSLTCLVCHILPLMASLVHNETLLQLEYLVFVS